jgi:hypothetical protein
MTTQYVDAAGADNYQNTVIYKSSQIIAQSIGRHGQSPYQSVCAMDSFVKSVCDFNSLCHQSGFWEILVLLPGFYLLNP